MKTMPLLLLLCTTAVAQEAPETAPAPPTPAPCADAEHRQFDFWIGAWNVTANGNPAGHNRIEVILGGCALREQWTSARGGFAGTSLNLYDKARGVWHQSWVDTSGQLLQLDGGIEDGRMVLEGKRPGGNGGEVTHRITWTPNEDGTVRQFWQSSADGGEWTTLFDGLYVKAGEEE